MGGEPGENTMGMVEVGARELLCLGVEEELILADGA